ncbi:MAG: beta-galactosidase, partial [Oscillospiraceae bacterium]|nr:beta-galactosidase [Oscillospiraceae bacterium]
LAVAGDVKDSITLEKVETEPSIYTLPEFNERREGVANWFATMGSMDLAAPMEFPEGKYSVKDNFEAYAKSPEALAIARKAMKLATNFDIVPGEGMWNMMKNMSPYGMMDMMPMPEGFLESLNAKLIKIDKI